jgi:cation diffusion facilitator CzcD-associated flavoprotein CzcO
VILHVWYDFANLFTSLLYPAFAAKRTSLEHSYYEVYNQTNVELVSLKETTIAEITEIGIKMQDGKEYELDVLVFATGFDAITGGLTQMDIRDRNGVSIKERWSQGINSYLGMAISGFPNLFYMYGPQSPSVFCNGPTCAEIQGNWLADTIDYMEKNKLNRIEAQPDAEIEYKKLVEMVGNFTLLPTAERLVMILHFTRMRC